MEVRLTCPLGHTCETAKDGHVERCHWYMDVEGENPQNGEKIKKKECAIIMNPILLIENTREANMLNASIQSLRNETIQRQDLALKLAMDKNLVKLT